jgi:serine/threonine-protein kinase RsbW
LVNGLGLPILASPVTEIDQPQPATRQASVMRIDATVHDLARVRQFIRDEAARAGADPGAISDLVQAVDESVCNVIVHGYDGTPGTVEVEVARNGASLVVRLRDQAPPFDPTSVASADVNKPLEQQRLGGLGILLMRSMTDAISWRPLGAGGGNELTLTKKLGET